MLVQLLFTPLLAGWAAWAGIAVSTRSTDVRAAQQMSVLGSAPPLIIIALMSLNVITVSTALTIGLAGAWWPSTCSRGASWPRCSTADGS